MRQFLPLILAVLTVRASLFCPHTAYPSNDNDLTTVTIQAKQLSDSNAFYRITDNESDPSFKRFSTHFKLLTARDNNECPFRGCLVELSPAEPKSHNTRLYQTSVIGKMIPPGFFPLEITQRFYCVLTDGDCGANVPLYRHYKVTTGGIFHAYTIDPSEIIEGYIKESTPLCYVWERQKPTVLADAPANPLFPPFKIENLIPKPIKIKSHEKEFDPNSQEDNAVLDIDELCAHDDKKALESSMKHLNELFNNKEGLNKDHLYTTKGKVDGYKKIGTLGKVVTNVRASNCKCLVQLEQLRFKGENGLPGLDHKLTREQKEPPSFNKYFLTGEQVYCAPEQNACGATVALRKWYNFGDADTMLTADSTAAPPMTGPLPEGVLCWIWPKDYHQDSTEVEMEEEHLERVDPKAQKKVSEEKKDTKNKSEEDLEGSGSGQEVEEKKPKEVKEVKEKKEEEKKDEVPEGKKSEETKEEKSSESEESAEKSIKDTKPAKEDPKKETKDRKFQVLQFQDVN